MSVLSAPLASLYFLRIHFWPAKTMYSSCGVTDTYEVEFTSECNDLIINSVVGGT